jgi:hypothetical protein
VKHASAAEVQGCIYMATKSELPVPLFRLRTDSRRSSSCVSDLAKLEFPEVEVKRMASLSWYLIHFPNLCEERITNFQ